MASFLFFSNFVKDMSNPQVSQPTPNRGHPMVLRPRTGKTAWDALIPKPRTTKAPQQPAEEMHIAAMDVQEFTWGKTINLN